MIQNNNFQGRRIEIRPYKLIELATLYGTNSKTFKKWIEPYADEIGQRKGYFYTIKQVTVIFAMLKPPSFLEIGKMLEKAGKSRKI